MSKRGGRSSKSWVLGLVALGALTVALPQPATADWLVLKDGSRVETDGGWSQRGKLLVFTGTDGSLLSLRLDEVDLEASERATQEAVEAASRPPDPPAPRKPSVFRLTDADVSHVDDEAESGSADAAGEGGAGTGEP